MSAARNYCAIGAMIASVFFLVPATAQAAGFGAYFEYGRGIGHLSESGYDFDYDANKYGFGFALDTNVSRNSLFNYRLNVGYQRTTREWEFGFEEDLNGFSLNNMFGFGVYRDQNIRVWLGPSVRLGVDVVSNPKNSFGSGTDSVVDLNVGGGLALGVNVHTGDVGSAAFTFGYQYLYLGEFVSGGDFDGRSWNGGSSRISFNLTYLFRSKGDRFD
jgi:hypothetical protein